MKQILRQTLLASLAAAAAQTAVGATITLQNAGFQSSGNNTNPIGWTTVEESGGVYIYANPGATGGVPADTNVLAFQARDSQSVQQSLNSGEATADSFSLYTVTFDSGWRNNTSAPNDLSLKFEIVNVTDGGPLAEATYTFPANSPSNASDTYRVIQAGNTLNLTYDNTLASLINDEIALKISTITSQDTYFVTGWIDNISVTAVPEPGSLALLGLGGLMMARRRRG